MAKKRVKTSRKLPAMARRDFWRLMRGRWADGWNSPPLQGKRWARP